MKIALIDATPKSELYPLPLLKLGAWVKDRGDQCQLFLNGKLPAAKKFDEIWITTRFTFDMPFALGVVREAKKRARRVWVGGISASLLPEYYQSLGVDVHIGLLPEAEHYAPDYSILGHNPEYSITHTSRGCIRKCGFCMVSKLEKKFEDRAGWELDLSPHTKKVLFYDNNWIAKPFDELSRDVGIIRRLIKEKSINDIDFNQGLDARLVTDKIADLLQGLPIRPVRFAFDGMHEDKHIQNAIGKMAERGFKSFRNYVLYNFMDHPSDFYYRLREHVRLAHDLNIDVEAFPMRYQPILDINNQRDFIGKHWTKKERQAFMLILAKHSIYGQISTRDMDEFEFWFGKDENEFIALLNYPRIGELAKRKQGALRMKRAVKRNAKKKQ
jgi:hypothetical protein